LLLPKLVSIVSMLCIFLCVCPSVVDFILYGVVLIVCSRVNNF
jgi:hypothetical protein